MLGGTVTGGPAADRGNHIGARDGLSVVELQAIAEREGVRFLVVGHAPLVDHLRFDVTVVVQPEQGVVDQQTVVAGHVGRRPDRIEDLEVAMQDDTRRLRRGGRQLCLQESRVETVAAVATVPFTNVRRDVVICFPPRASLRPGRHYVLFLNRFRHGLSCATSTMRGVSRTEVQVAQIAAPRNAYAFVKRARGRRPPFSLCRSDVRKPVRPVIDYAVAPQMKKIGFPSPSVPALADRNNP